MKRLTLLLLFSLAAHAQPTISIAAPAASATISGFRYTLQCSVGAMTRSIFSVEYQIDGETTGFALADQGGGCPSLVWNSFYAGNGAAHQVKAIARDALGNILATSPAVGFAVENNLPQNTCATTCSDIAVQYAGTASAYSVTNTAADISVIGIKGGSGIPSISQKSVASGGFASTKTVALSIPAGHSVLAWWRINSTSQSGTCSDSSGSNVYTNGTSTGTADGYKVAWCYFINLPASIAGVILTASGGATAFVVNALDVTCPGGCSIDDITSATNNRIGGFTHYSQAFSGSANELYLGGVAVQTALGPVSPGSGWTLQTLDSQPFTMTESAAATSLSTSSTFSGITAITVTANGPHATATKNTNVYADGMMLFDNSGGGGSTSAAITAFVDSSQLSNASHQVVVDQFGPDCPGCEAGKWTWMGQDERTVTFSNGAALQELRLSASIVQLCTTAQTLCPTSATLSGTLVKTDGTTSAATITSCVANPNVEGSPVVATSLNGGSCVLTQSIVGTAMVTLTETGGRARSIWVNVDTINSVPNFALDGSIQQNYSTSPPSFFRASTFYSYGVMFPVASNETSSINYAAMYAPLLSQGTNTFETSMPVPPTGTETAWNATVSNAVSIINPLCTTYGFKAAAFDGTNWWSTWDALTRALYGPGSTFSTPALQRLLSAYAGGSCGGNTIDAVDEMTGKYPGNPLQGVGTGGVTLGAGNVAQLTCSGGIWTATWPNYTFAGAMSFIVTGTGVASIDYNTATGQPAPFVASKVDASHFTFSAACGSAPTTGLIEPLADQTFKADFSACPNDGSVACPNYLHYNAFATMRGWQTASGTNYPKITFPPIGGDYGTDVAWFGGKNTTSNGVRLADYLTVYFPGEQAYVPNHISLQTVVATQGQSTRKSYNDARRDSTPSPLLSLTNGTISNYVFHGYPVAVAGRVGSLLTFAVPHGVYNIVPSVTRLIYNGVKYFVSDCPTAITCHVALLSAATTGVSSATGTATFADGSALTIKMDTTFAQNGFNWAQILGSNDAGTCSTTRTGKRGQSFTMSGTGTALDGKSYWYSPANVNNCGNSGGGGTHQVWELPTGTEVGGTASFTPSNWYVRGGGSYGTDSDIGPTAVFASTVYCAILKCAGFRNYGLGFDPQGQDLTLLGSNSVFDVGIGAGNYAPTSDEFDNLNWDASGTGAVQGHLNPLRDFSRSKIHWNAMRNAFLLLDRLKPWLFQPLLNAPDDGPFFESTVRQDGSGNTLLLELAMSDGPQTCTANLTPYLIAGQPIIRYYATWKAIQVTTISAGTTSDSTTCEPGAVRAYVFDHAQSTALQQPAFAARLTDIPNANKIVVEYGYNSYAFGQQTDQLPTVFDCGTGNCILPVDNRLGMLYYRLLYLDNNGALLAKSDVQTL